MILTFYAKRAHTLAPDRKIYKKPNVTEANLFDTFGVRRVFQGISGVLPDQPPFRNRKTLMTKYKNKRLAT